ncbi:MAG: enoyl-CoA hydratase/isomerase family protein [Sinobacteraceae bacterium]|nr:enoyl-CoA hydratase/isomerase family protein [Nevskiaceae bacterium]MCP5340039.1 enoyl-CoA hydratase/isomerase family protein [Nevskiaceae bacterium]MCP5359263.1 enoyl-CoA hydratase/isomerase family protein [Nevskiaceae bacterium]MCP5466492.1 enoyl-CoA hydratase/isomerase family protein [Nevskiaceae bacterium]MCP5471801.1 enoyl-CoA hydratase/isomerase family protein [Nevskiaceae bacterium]
MNTQSAAGAASVIVERSLDGAVAQLWLDRPARRNAFDAAMIAELTTAIERLGGEPALRVLILGGRGPAFCAGADLGWMACQGVADEQANRADALRLARLFEALDHCPCPTVARVQGACFGGGLGLVAACDLAIAADDARFALSEAKIGVLPATIGPYVLRAIGYRAASRYMLTAEVFDASEAARIGLIHQTVPSAELDATIARRVASLLGCGPRAQREIKRLLRDLVGRPIDAALLADTADRIAAARASDEGREGLQAMLDKRAPPWAPGAGAVVDAGGGAPPSGDQDRDRGQP